MSNEVIDREKIRNLNIAVIGQQCIAHYLTFYYTGFGVGHICLVRDDITYGRPYEFMYFNKSVIDKARSLGDSLKEIYTGLDVSIVDKVELGGLERVLNLDLIIESTNNSNAKRSCLDLAKKKKLPFLSLSSNKYSASICFYDPNEKYNEPNKEEFYMRSYNGQTQGAITSGLAAALALELTARLCFPQNEDNLKVKNPFHYNLLSKRRFDLNNDFEPKEDYSKKRILAVGLGAIGTIATTSIALSSDNRENSLDLMDPDITDKTNLIRQMFYSKGLGKPKPEVLGEKLKEIAPKLNITPYYGSIGMKPSDDEEKRGVKFFDQEFMLEKGHKKYDLVLGCIDSPETISILSKWTLELGIPFINANSGISPITKVHREYGRVGVYVPNKTACINCQFSNKMDIKDAPKRGVQIIQNQPLSSQSQGPIHCLPQIVQKTPTLITPNAIVGIIQTGEAFNLLSGMENEFHLFDYDSTEDFRIKSAKKEDCSTCNNKCKCHEV